MSIEKPADERLELYNKFKNSLRSKSTDDIFFDADDLVVIIDQAVDFEDDFVQIEALMRGYRFFPDNEELASRRAFFYYDLNLDDGVANVIATEAGNSPSWKILQLRLDAAHLDSKEIDKRLNAIVNSTDKFDDEGMIQLVTCASACDRYEWLTANEKRLRKKTDYLPTLLYELFMASQSCNDSEYGVKLLEELTELEPFNIEFWMSLAFLQESTGNHQAAMNSVEYALAIDNQHTMALILKAELLWKEGKYEESLKISDELMSMCPTPEIAELNAKSFFCLNVKNPDKAFRQFQKYCLLYPESRTLVKSALLTEIPGVSKILDAHFMATFGNEELQPWSQWAHEFYFEGSFFAAAEVLLCMKRHNILLPNETGLLASSLYYSKRYNEAIVLLLETLEWDGNMSRESIQLMPSHEVVIAGMLSTLRTATQKVAQQLLNDINSTVIHPCKVGSLSTELETMGFEQFLKTLSELINRYDKAEIDQFVNKFQPFTSGLD